MKRRDVIELKNILGMSENTGTVLVSPTTIGIKATLKAAREIPLDGCLKDLGVFVANVLADNLTTQGHRPANYSDVKDLGKKLRARLVTLLTDDEDSKSFDESFVLQMRNRG